MCVCVCVCVCMCVCVCEKEGFKRGVRDQPTEAAATADGRRQTHRFLNPRLGRRRCSGVCPPSKPWGMLTLARFFCPFIPRPLVLPRPDPIPRPTRLRCCFECALGGYEIAAAAAAAGGWGLSSSSHRAAIAPPKPRFRQHFQRDGRPRRRPQHHPPAPALRQGKGPHSHRLLGPRVVAQRAQAQQRHIGGQAPRRACRRAADGSSAASPLQRQQAGPGAGSLSPSPPSSCSSQKVVARAAPHGSASLAGCTVVCVGVEELERVSGC